jgi:hypothetical protein
VLNELIVRIGRLEPSVAFTHSAPSDRYFCFVFNFPKWIEPEIYNPFWLVNRNQKSNFNEKVPVLKLKRELLHKYVKPVYALKQVAASQFATLPLIE